MQYEVSRVTESLQMFTTTITAIVTNVTVRTVTHIKQWTIFSNIMGISEPTFLKILHNCLVFHSPCLFSQICNTKLSVSTKLVMLCVTAHLLATEMITFLDKEMPLFLWSAIQLFTYASRSGHFAMYRVAHEMSYYFIIPLKL
jgi:hypothetical protein